jgi:hypothetical protein
MEITVTTFCRMKEKRYIMDMGRNEKLGANDSIFIAN